MGLLKKVLALMTFVFIFSYSSIISLGNLNTTPKVQAATTLGISNVVNPDMFVVGSLKSKIKSNNVDKLEETIDKAGEETVDLAREIAIVIAVGVVIWMGYSLWFKKTAEGLADMKGRLGLLVLAIAFIFFTEQILGALFGIFGYKL